MVHICVVVVPTMLLRSDGSEYIVCILIVNVVSLCRILYSLLHAEYRG